MDYKCPHVGEECVVAHGHKPCVHICVRNRSSRPFREISASSGCVPEIRSHSHCSHFVHTCPFTFFLLSCVRAFVHALFRSVAPCRYVPKTSRLSLHVPTYAQKTSRLSASTYVRTYVATSYVRAQVHMYDVRWGICTQGRSRKYRRFRMESVEFGQLPGSPAPDASLGSGRAG